MVMTMMMLVLVMMMMVLGMMLMLMTPLQMMPSGQATVVPPLSPLSVMNTSERYLVVIKIMLVMMMMMNLLEVIHDDDGQLCRENQLRKGGYHRFSYYGQVQQHLVFIWSQFQQNLV